MSVRTEIDAAFNPVLRFLLAAQRIHQFLRLTRGSVLREGVAT
jgi:hypothetical protein